MMALIVESVWCDADILASVVTELYALIYEGVSVNNGCVLCVSKGNICYETFRTHCVEGGHWIRRFSLAKIRRD